MGFEVFKTGIWGFADLKVGIWGSEVFKTGIWGFANLGFEVFKTGIWGFVDLKVGIWGSLPPFTPLITFKRGVLPYLGIWDLVLLRLGFGDLVSLVWDLGLGFAHS